MDGIIAYILSKKYTNDTVIGMGAIKGAACQVQSINKVGKTTTVTLKWEDNTGGIHTQSFEIEDGADGVSVSNATINASGNLILTLSDGNTIDCGKVLPQYDTMPTPSSSNEGQILQYIGTTTSDYTNGYFYECINDSGTYKWVEKLVQDSYTKSEIGNLDDLPDDTKNVVQNIGDLKLSIDQLSASKLSKTDVDNVLSTTSENPVQNKVITDALDDKENKFRVTLIPIASASDVGKIIQYIGSNTSSLTSGYYYQCVEVSTGVYDWIQKNVQPSNGGTGGDGVVDGYYNSADQLFYEDIAHTNPISGDSNTLYVSVDTNLVYRFNGTIFIRVDEVVGEDDVINGYYNTIDGKFYEDSTYTTEITGETGKIYISIDTNIQYRWDNISMPNKFVPITATIDVDDNFSTTSTNPIQNKVITTKINDIDVLMGSKLSLSDVDDALNGTSVNPVQNKIIKEALDNIDLLLASKVDKETGKGLSTNDYTNEDKQKVVNLAPVYLIGSGLTLDTTVGSPTYGKLQATGMSIPIDDELSEISINPVQNKVIALKIDQLQGSVLDKIRKRLSAQEDNFAVWNNNGEIEDSGISKDIIPTTASASNKVLVKSDVDNALSTTSENPVQNKEITVPLQALQGSVLNIKSDITDLQNNKQDKLIEGNGIDIDSSNNISLDISYLTASRIGYIPNAEKGTANGVAELDSTGKVPSSQLPSNELNDLNDVIITSPVNKQILAYNSTSGKWENQTGQETIGGIVPKGSILFANLPTTGMSNGDAYDIKDAFVTDNRFEEGSGIECGAGTDIVWIADENKWNILTPAGVYSFNGRTGAVTPAASDYDAEQVDYDNTTSGLTATNVQDGIDELSSEKADKVTSAINGHLAGLDTNGNLTDSGVVANDVIQKVTTATGLLKDDGTVDTTTYATSANAYLVGDTAETTIDDTDYFPFYDTSATGKRKTLFSSIVNKLKATFATLVTGTFTAGNLVSLDSSGNIADSGKKASDFQTVSLADFTGDLNTLTTAGYKQYKAKLSDLTNAPTVSYTPMECYIDVWSDTNNVYQTIRIVGLTYSPSAKYSSTFKRSSYNTGSVLSWGAWEQIDNKISIVSGATQNDIAIFDANGGVADSNVLISSLPTILPASSPTPTEASVVSDINGVSANTTKAASAYALQQYSNEKKVRRVITGTTPIGSATIGSTGIGTWDDSATPTETDWWEDDAFKIPDSRNDIDLSLKFDPSSGEPVTLGGYILDTTTGKLCIKFGNSIATPANAKIAVDITYTRNEYS